MDKGGSIIMGALLVVSIESLIIQFKMKQANYKIIRNGDIINMGSNNLLLGEIRLHFYYYQKEIKLNLRK